MAFVDHEVGIIANALLNSRKPSREHWAQRVGRHLPRHGIYRRCMRNWGRRLLMIV